MTEESTAEMPTAEMPVPSDPLMDVGNILPEMSAASSTTASTVYDAQLGEDILKEAEVKNAGAIAAALLLEVDDVRYWEDMDLQDVRAVDAVPNVAAALIRRAMVKGLAAKGLIGKGCAEGVLGKEPSTKWAGLLAKATDAPPCPSGDPGRAFIPTRQA